MEHRQAQQETTGGDCPLRPSGEPRARPRPGARRMVFLSAAVAGFPIGAPSMAWCWECTSAWGAWSLHM